MSARRRKIQSLNGVLIALLLTFGAVFPMAGAAAQTPGQDEGVTALSTLAAVVSDDFNRCSTGSDIGNGWQVVKPSDTTVKLVNGFSKDASVEISVPAGSKHIMSNGNFSAPRIMQNLATSAADDVTDFEVELKFDSQLTYGSLNQVQGVLFAELNTDPATKGAIPYSRFARFDFHTNDNELRYTVARYNMADVTPFNATVGVIADLGTIDGPLYLRIGRETKHYWTMSYSLDGTNYTRLDLVANTLPSGEVKRYSMYFDLTANQYGPFIGNTGENPEFTGQIDYFMNTASRITNEDQAENKIYETINGQGGIDYSPSLPGSGVYACGEDVELTANPDNGWTFNGWGGDVAGQGSKNPITVTMNGPLDVTAVFTNQGTGGLTVQGFIPFVSR